MVEDLPIVYVRGFAGGTDGINRVVTDPFYGFNEGSTAIRVGGDGEPLFHQFESPLLRLHLDEGYEIGGPPASLDEAGEVAPNSIWIHRFYDVSATTWGDKPQEYSLERAADDLYTLIRKLRDKTGGKRVHLVAHSMGGLICRCLLQKVLPDRGENPADHVEKLFTYATPHGGIAFDIGFGLLERARDLTGIYGADVFGRERMYQYLTPAAQRGGKPPDDWRPEEIPPGSFPLDRVFCLIGTNPENYDTAHGLSALAVGPKSDGLVQIEKAYVPGARHAFVHRSHSGPYGVVNSEEGYQNLRRFLFGDLQVRVDLVGALPVATRHDVSWQAEVRLSIRGLAIVMHEQTAEHWCPIQLSLPVGQDTADTPYPLLTLFLSSRAPRPDQATGMRYGLHLRLLSVEQSDHTLWFGNHLERVADFDDILIVDMDTGAAGLTAAAKWNSEIGGALRDYEPGEAERLADENPVPGVWVASVPLPAVARPILGPAARLRLTVTARG
ncbi:esterase/lipase family protein [Cryptosporangium sp. NPDC051539]|uniref:esterase/lipase family protein n=1 Tax=Cryptosporangium sp. NPDC051539 TaxID=3363962 RepID=UPI0037B38BF9